MNEITFAEKDEETLTVLLDGKAAGSLRYENAYDEFRGEWRERYYPEIAGERLGLDRGYRTREAAAAKIRARHNYLRRETA